MAGAARTGDQLLDFLSGSAGTPSSGSAMLGNPGLHDQRHWSHFAGSSYVEALSTPATGRDPCSMDSSSNQSSPHDISQFCTTDAAVGGPLTGDSLTTGGLGESRMASLIALRAGAADLPTPRVRTCVVG